MNASLSNLTAIAADLNAAGKEVSVKRLPTRKMRKGEGLSRDQQHGKGAAKGNLGGLDSISGAGAAVGSGFHCRPINSMGGRPVANVDAVVARAKRQYAADRRAAARERLMDKIDAALALWYYPHSLPTANTVSNL